MFLETPPARSNQIGEPFTEAEFTLGVAPVASGSETMAALMPNVTLGTPVTGVFDAGPTTPPNLTVPEELSALPTSDGTDLWRDAVPLQEGSRLTITVESGAADRLIGGSTATTVGEFAETVSSSRYRVVGEIADEESDGYSDTSPVVATGVSEAIFELTGRSREMRARIVFGSALIGTAASLLASALLQLISSQQATSALPTILPRVERQSTNGRRVDAAHGPRSTVRLAVWSLAPPEKAPYTTYAQAAHAVVALDPDLLVITDLAPTFDLLELERHLRECSGLAYRGEICDASLGNDPSARIAILCRTEVWIEQFERFRSFDLAQGRTRFMIAINAEVSDLEFKVAVSGVDLALQDHNLPPSRVASAPDSDPYDALRAWVASGEKVLLFADSAFQMDGTLNHVSAWERNSRSMPRLGGDDGPAVSNFAISPNMSTRYVRGSLQRVPLHWALNMGRRRFERSISSHTPLVASVLIRLPPTAAPRHRTEEKRRRK
ncbi:MAG: hypothetical protein AAF467_13245 [Actinomycetota bacterium]